MFFWLPASVSLLIGIAGWHYLFFSRAAHRLGTIEAESANARRIVLRRTNGVALILLAALLYAGCTAIDPKGSPQIFVAAWIAIFALLSISIVLALIDLRLTLRVRGKGIR